jgi:heterodisulfide reductase subunit C
MDLYPDEVIRRVNLAQIDKVLICDTIWICSACETCTTRCPNEVDIAGVMDFLKEQAIVLGLDVPQQKSYIFHESFMKEIEKRGRIFEGSLMQRYMIKSGELFSKIGDGSIFEELKLGFDMFRKGRMPLLPERIKGKKEVRKLFDKEK